MASKLLKNESNHSEWVGFWLSDDCPDDQKRDIEEEFKLDYKGGLRGYCNDYMQRTIKAINKGIVSLNEFSILDDEEYSLLLSSNRLNENLQKEFFQLIQEKSHFVETMSSWLLGELSGKQKERFDKLFQDKDPIAACNRYMKRTIRNIKRGFFSRKNFADIQYAKMFSVWLNDERLDRELQIELSQLLYGADERKRYSC